MKHLNKLTALLLALVMVLALAVTVFAAGGTGSITIENPQKNQTYTAYKIFDVVYNADQSAYSYTIAKDSEWFTVILEYMNRTIDADGSFTGTGEAKPGTDGVYTGNGITLTPPASDPDTYVVEIDADKFSAPSFAKYLNREKAGKTGKELVVNNGKAEVSGLDLGYYFVSSTSGALCNLTTTNPDATIHDKNDMPFDKVDDKTDVEIGEIVSYTITCKVPDTSEFKNYNYVVTDTMSKGLTLNKDSIEIWISDDDKLDKTADQELGDGYYTLYDTNATAFGDTNTPVDFRVDFDAIKMNGASPSLMGKYVFITYSAKVNEKAVARIEKNTATLTYSNDPTDHTSHGTRTDEEEVYSAKILIDKYAANPKDPYDKSGKKLADASFVLYKETTEGKTLYYFYNETDSQVEWVADKKDATVAITDDQGAAEFIGLKDGTYYLLETAAPAGYNLLKDPVEVIIDDANAAAALTHTVGVANNTGAELPSTGGPGTTLFYILGGVLAVSAAVLLITKRRMRGEE